MYHYIAISVKDFWDLGLYSTGGPLHNHPMIHSGTCGEIYLTFKPGTLNLDKLIKDYWIELIEKESVQESIHVDLEKQFSQ